MKVQTVFIATLILAIATAMAAKAIEHAVPESVSQLVVGPLAHSVLVFSFAVIAAIVLPRAFPRLAERPKRPYLVTFRNKRDWLMFALALLLISAFELGQNYFQSGSILSQSSISHVISAVVVWCAFALAVHVIRRYSLVPPEKPERHW